MAIIDTVLIGESILREETTPITDFADPKIQQTVTDLIDTMRHAELLGIAAPQIGESYAIFVSEIRETAYRKGVTDTLRVYINPKITNVSRETVTGWEGCGSILEPISHRIAKQSRL